MQHVVEHRAEQMAQLEVPATAIAVFDHGLAHFQAELGWTRDLLVKVVAPSVGVRPGDRLLAVRGSGWALGFLTQGPIFDEALQHPELETFSAEP